MVGDAALLPIMGLRITGGALYGYGIPKPS